MGWENVGGTEVPRELGHKIAWIIVIPSRPQHIISRPGIRKFYHHSITIQLHTRQQRMRVRVWLISRTIERRVCLSS